MLSRVLSGIVMAVGIIAVLLYTPWWGFAVVVGLAGALGGREYLRMARPEATSGEHLLFIVSCLAVVLWPVIARVCPGYSHGIALGVSFFVLALARLARPTPIESALPRLSLDVCGLLYLGATFPFILLMRLEPGGGWIVLLAMVITFGSDTGAYFSGRFLGKHKLYPLVSPKKTIEGAVGGMATAIGCTFLCQAYFPGLSGLTTIDCVLLGGVGAMFAIVGDLIESLMKRSFDVKDSGDLIPGHGGILDRIDALLFCGPFVWLYLEYVVR
jgi:phosphatidate cytidylyltransferase